MKNALVPRHVPRHGVCAKASQQRVEGERRHHRVPAWPEPGTEQSEASVQVRLVINNLGTFTLAVCTGRYLQSVEASFLMKTFRGAI